MSISRLDESAILVLGGKGKTGRRVVARLRALGKRVRACSRSTQPRFDWNDSTTWSATLAGMKSVYVTYQPDLAVPGALATVSAFFDAALAQEVEHIVLLSGRGEDEAQAAERALQASGARWTILRCSWFMQNFSESFLLDPIREGMLALPLNGVREPFVDADDIAEVAVAALTQPGHDARLHELTGPSALSFADAIACIATAARRDVRLMDITPETFGAGLLAAGVPTEEADLILYLFTTVLDGRNAKPADGVRLALQREPRSFADYAQASAASGVWSV